jgi:hypothetical protein
LINYYTNCRNKKNSATPERIGSDGKIMSFSHAFSFPFSWLILSCREDQNKKMYKNNGKDSNRQADNIFLIKTDLLMRFPSLSPG